MHDESKENKLVFKPGIAGRIRFLFNQVFAYFVIAMLAFFGLGYLAKKIYFTRPMVMVIMGVAVLGLLVILFRVFFSPYIFEVSEESIIARSIFKQVEYSFRENEISPHTTTYRYNGIPYNVTRVVTISPKMGGNAKNISGNGYSKKSFSKLINAVQRVQDQLKAEERARLEAENPSLISNSPIVHIAEANTKGGPVVGEAYESTLNKQATYAVVNDPRVFYAKSNAVVGIVFIALALISIVTGVIIKNQGFLLGVLGFGIFFIICGIIMIATYKNTPRGTIMGAEFSPMGLVLHSKGIGERRYQWGEITNIIQTPDNYGSSMGKRQVTICTPQGKESYSFGYEQNSKLSENYHWFTEYMKLYALGKIEYLF